MEYENYINGEEQERNMAYYCTKCRRNHNGNSEIGIKHKCYSGGIVKKKKWYSFPR